MFTEVCVASPRALAPDVRARAERVGVAASHARAVQEAAHQKATLELDPENMSLNDCIAEKDRMVWIYDSSRSDSGWFLAAALRTCACVAQGRASAI